MQSGFAGLARKLVSVESLDEALDELSGVFGRGVDRVLLVDDGGRPRGLIVFDAKAPYLAEARAAWGAFFGTRAATVGRGCFEDCVIEAEVLGLRVEE